MVSFVAPRADLLLLLWPVFFIAAARQDPHLKGRNFRKSVTRGSELVVGLSKPVRHSVSLRRTTADAEAERPAWETPDASARDQV